jgi:hypothetical protein
MPNNSFATATPLRPVLSGGVIRFGPIQERLGRSDRVDFLSLAVPPGRFRSSAQVKLTDVGAKEQLNLRAQLFFRSPEVTQNQIVPVRSFRITRQTRTAILTVTNPGPSQATLYVKFSSPMKNLKYRFSVDASQIFA